MWLTKPNNIKNKLFKIIWISLTVLAGMFILLFALYVFLYYPRKAESFEVNVSNPTRRILIATQSTNFKDILIQNLCDSLSKSSIYIKGIDVRNLKEVNESDWDKILIINSFIINLNKNIDRFINGAKEPDKILVFVTSGGADWKPDSQFKVDAITSASREIYINDLVELITDWINKEEGGKWEPGNYLLALRYFSQVDVSDACILIEIEQDKYKELYPNLVSLINNLGYYYLRLNDVHSALKIFELNIKLFPDNWNTYDSYGEALLADGNYKSAINNYQKALILNPDSKSIRTRLKKLKSSE